MAKLKGPLFSLGATQQLGKTLVYFPWKGLNVVRSYVIPANPKTTLQKTQRGYLTAAVAMIHTALARAAQPLNEADKSAYALWASLYKDPRTWFNQIVKMWLDVKVDGHVPVIYSDGVTVVTAHDAAEMRIYFNKEADGDMAGARFYLGTTRTALILSAPATITDQSYAAVTGDDAFTTLTAGVKYFWQFRPNLDDPCEGARSGIYSFRAT